MTLWESDADPKLPQARTSRGKYWRAGPPASQLGVFATPQRSGRALRGDDRDA